MSGLLLDLGGGARVTLDGRQEVVSDAFGRFVLSNVTRGMHRVVVQKSGYEGRSEAIDFESASQVLYVRLESSRQLADRADSALAKKQYAAAASLLKRVRAVDPKGVTSRFLSAVLSFRRSRRPRGQTASRRGVCSLTRVIF